MGSPTGQLKIRPLVSVLWHLFGDIPLVFVVVVVLLLLLVIFVDGDKLLKPFSEDFAISKPFSPYFQCIVVVSFLSFLVLVWVNIAHQNPMVWNLTFRNIEVFPTFNLFLMGYMEKGTRSDFEVY